MIKKYIFLVAIVSAFFLLDGCEERDNNNQDSESISIEDTVEERTSLNGEDISDELMEIAEVYEEIGGSWEVGYIYNRGQWIDINENESLKDLYDSIFLFVNEDGTFLYDNFYLRSGIYKTYDKEGSGVFLLKTDRTFKYVFDEEKNMQEEDVENADMKTYIIRIQDEENSTISICEFDALTGKERADEDPYLLVKRK